MKVGRNQACPCGSGKKYKKCCLPKEEAARAERRAQQTAPDPRDTLRGFFERRKRLEDIANSDTSAIVERLAAMGVAVSQEDFLAFAENNCSYESFAEGLIESVGVEGQEADVVYIACDELWKRWLPDKPCIEYLAHLLHDAAHPLSGDSKDSKRYCDSLQQVWKETVGLCHRLRIHDIEKLESLFEDCDIYIDWIDDLVMELGNCGLRDPGYANRGIQIVEEALALFSESSIENSFLELLRTDALRLYFIANREEEGIARCKEKIERHPHRSAGYVELAEGLQMNLSRKSPAEQRSRLEQSIHILQTAKAYPVADGPDWDLDYRLQELLEQR